MGKSKTNQCNFTKVEGQRCGGTKKQGSLHCAVHCKDTYFENTCKNKQCKQYVAKSGTECYACRASAKRSVQVGSDDTERVEVQQESNHDLSTGLPPESVEEPAVEVSNPEHNTNLLKGPLIDQWQKYVKTGDPEELSKTLPDFWKSVGGTTMNFFSKSPETQRSTVFQLLVKLSNKRTYVIEAWRSMQTIALAATNREEATKALLICLHVSKKSVGIECFTSNQGKRKFATLSLYQQLTWIQACLYATLEDCGGGEELQLDPTIETKARLTSQTANSCYLIKLLMYTFLLVLLFHVH